MLSRVADCAYWMSRYLERAEHTARLGGVSSYPSIDRSSDVVRRLMATIGRPPAGYGATPSSPAEMPAEQGDDRVQLHVIGACVAAARENARQVREQISSEMWAQLNRLYLNVRQHDT